MQRRSQAVEGCVNFPIHQASTNEGGMLVKLWVIDRQEFDDAYGMCCGVAVWDKCSETFLGTDKESFPSDTHIFDPETQHSPEKFNQLLNQHTEETNAWKNRFFTGAHHEDSVPLMASIVMGSTGWSGDFICKYEDLTSDGKAIYDNMAKLYPKAELHLMTFLDT